MSTDVATTTVRPGYEIDADRLDAWMSDHVEGFRGPVAVRQFGGGQSNPTYALSASSGRYVLRRKPPGPILKGAHAVEREARIMRGLHAQGFPVPKIYAQSDDESVVGTAFYVMEHVEGRIFWDATLPNVPSADRPTYFHAMSDVMARLHALDPDAIGLGQYGRSGNYFERQLARWSSQYSSDQLAGRDPNMDRLIGWLADNLPGEEECALIHGDFRCDNLIFRSDRAEILAVIDWELSTLGHPLADFTYLTMMYRLPPHIVGGLRGVDLRQLNIPAEDELVSRYCEMTGRREIPNYQFYMAFNLFRLSAIFHGIKGRLLRGNAVSESARQRAAALPELAAISWAEVSG